MIISTRINMKKILILEDDPDIGEIVEIALSPKYVTLVKRTDKGLQEHINSFQPDVMLIDNHIGQTDASVIISKIKAGENYKSIPFILFSGSNDIKTLAEELGATAYLPKPFNLNQLYQCVENVLTIEA